MTLSCRSNCRDHRLRVGVKRDAIAAPRPRHGQHLYLLITACPRAAEPRTAARPVSRGLPPLWLIFNRYMTAAHHILLTAWGARHGSAITGFSDATEIFIFISGYTGARFVYGDPARCWRPASWSRPLPFLRRVWQIYVAHVFCGYKGAMVMTDDCVHNHQVINLVVHSAPPGKSPTNRTVTEVIWADRGIKPLARPPASGKAFLISAK